MTRLRPGTGLLRAERGVAMVEFAILLPFVLLLMFAVAEIGRAILTYNTLTKAIQDGIRHAASNSLLGNTGTISIDAALETEIKNLVVYGDIQGNGQPLLEGLSVSQITVTSPGPFLIEVSAAYPYTPIMGSTLPTFGLGGPVNLAVDLRAAMTMRALS